MIKRSKRYLKTSAKVEKGKAYTVTDAIKVLKENPTKFDQSVEVHLNLGIDPKKSDQLVRGLVQLPNGTGKTKKIIAFVPVNKEAEAKAAGADIIGNDEVIQKIKQTGKIDFEVAVATPEMMKKIAPIAKTLGQKGLMPNPKNETIGPNIKKMIEGVKAGKVSFKNDDTGNVHGLVGKLNFSEEKLKENIEAFIAAVRKVKPAASKGTFLKSVTVCTSMGPGIRLNIV
jgi:large subunit ribosomal protein L1